MSGIGNRIAFLTNIGLLFGLALVVYELRQNSVLMESEIYQQRTADLIAVESMIIESPELASALAKVRLENEELNVCALKGLTVSENTVFRSWLRAHAHRFSNLLHQYALGTLSESYLQSIAPYITRFAEPWRHLQIRQGNDLIEQYLAMGFKLTSQADIACSESEPVSVEPASYEVKTAGEL
jgi:hypothetical protein